ncbi:MAG: hypothetical protein WBF17_16575, partial [Phycisphaerae bacterium]
MGKPIDRRCTFAVLVPATAAALLAAAAAGAAPAAQLVLPLNRTAYQTNEAAHLAVIRSSPGALAAGDLVLTV